MATKNKYSYMCKLGSFETEKTERTRLYNVTLQRGLRIWEIVDCIYMDMSEN